MQFSIINYGQHVLYYVPMTYFIVGNVSLLTPFTLTPCPDSASGYHPEVVLCIFDFGFVCFVLFSIFPHKWHHMVFVFV